MVQLYIYVYVCVYILFLEFFSILVYHRILNTVPVLYNRPLLITYSHVGYTFNVLISSKVPIPVPSMLEKT